MSFRRLLVCTLPACTVAVAAAMASAQQAPQTCLRPVASLDAALAGLATEGWTALPDGTLPQAVADRLVWLYVAQYTTGDTGGETLASLIDLQARTVKALARKRDIPTSKTRILTHTDDAMLLLWRESVPGQVELQCRVALTAADAGGAEPSAQDSDAQITDGSVMTVTLDRATMSAAAGRDVLTTHLVETFLSYDPADLQ